jgi:hypothetical protein
MIGWRRHAPAKGALLGDRPRLRADRLAVCALFFSCAFSPKPVIVQPTPIIERWVSMDGTADGNGSALRPWRTVPLFVPADMTLRVSSGLYLGPFRIEGSVIGSGQVVLSAPTGTVVTCLRCTLTAVAVQGGQRGISIEAGATLANVLVTGASAESIVVQSGHVEAQAIRLEGTLTGSTGVVIEAQGALVVKRLATSGAYQRAIDNQGGRLTLDEWQHLNGSDALRSVGGVVQVSNSQLVGGRNNGLFVTKGQATFTNITISRFDVGLRLGGEASVIGERLRIENSSESGVTSTNAKLTLRNSRIQGSGPLGCLLADGSTVVVDQLEVGPCQAFGLLLRLTQATVQNVTVHAIAGDGPDSLGDGLVLRDGRTELTSTVVRDVAGSGVWATALAEVRFGELKVTRAAAGAVVAERKANVTGDTLHAEGSPAPVLSVLDGAKASVRRVVSANPSAPVLWAECSDDVHVTLGPVEAVEQPLPRPCLTRLEEK